MNWRNLRFPKALDAENMTEKIRLTLMNHTVTLWSGGMIRVPVIQMSDPLKNVLRGARLRGHIRCGFEAIHAKLEGERMGIANIRERQGLPYGDRVSRLLLFSNDGAERFYRHIEDLLKLHTPRVLGCVLDIDGSALGRCITDKDNRIKILMVEHKDDVSASLRSITAGSDNP